MQRTSFGALVARHRLVFSLLGVVAACAVILPACGDGGSINPTTPEPTTMTILVTSTPTTGTVLVGADRQYAIEVRDGSNVIMPAYTTATWSIVPSTGVATITSGGGLGSCVLVGTANVHAVGPIGPNGTNLTADTSVECVAPVCDDGIAATTDSFVNGACVYTYAGSITIWKDAQPDGPQDFHFAATGTGVSAFDLDDDADGAKPNKMTFASLSPGTYTFTETQLSGWNLASIACTPSTGATTNITTGLATIVLGVNEVVNCTFTNTAAAAAGSITIVKDANPDDGQDFGFTANHPAIPDFYLDDDGDPALSNQKFFGGLPAGAYTFTEAQTAGWDLTSITCTPSGSATVDIAAGTAAITLTAGVNVICTFVNTAATTGSLTIVKDAVPNDAQNFTFTTTGSGLSTFDLDDDPVDIALPNTKAFAGLATGVPFTVTEVATSGWTLGNVTCTQSGATGAAGASIAYTVLGVAVTLAPGTDVVCTFTNTAVVVPETGSLTIVKDAVPNDAQNFTFMTTGIGLSGFELDDDSDGTLPNTKTFAGLATGNPLTVTETATTGWTLSNVTCTQSGATGAAGASIAYTGLGVAVTLAAGTDVVCTFTNTAAAPPPAPDLAITKVGVVSGNTVTYTLTVTNGGTAPAPAPITVQDVLPATPAGSQFSAFSGACTGPTTGPVVCSSGSAGGPGAPLDPGSSLTYSITLTVPGGAGSVTNCATVAQGGDAATPAEPNLTNNESCATYSYSTPPDGTACDDGDVNTFNDAYLNGVCVGTPGTATITIVQEAVPDDAQNFHFATVGAGMTDFDLDDDADGTLPKTKTFTLAAGGPYTVTQAAVAGWPMTDIQCVVAVPGLTLTHTESVTRLFTISNLEIGAVVTCTFTNTH